MDFRNVKFKLFIRCDLYKRLDYDVLGADKFSAKKINLVWSDEDIRRLIAQRIMCNYFSVLDIKKLMFEIDDNKLYVDENSIDTEREEVRKHNDNLFARLFSKIRKAEKNKSRQIEGRHTTLDDEFSRQIITSVFPRAVTHSDKNGKSRQLNIFDYFCSHFSLSSETTTPRLIIMFLDNCLSITKNYYRNNLDEKVPLDNNCEYQLFKRKIVQRAYAEFQKEIAESFLNASSNWKEYFVRFTSQKGKKTDYTFPEFHKILGITDTDEVRRFIAFLCHIGYLRCQNPTAIPDDRKYSLPIMFQH